METDTDFDQNLKFSDESLQNQSHTHPKVELIHTIVNPRNEHLSLALEMLWRACKPGYCSIEDEFGLRSHRYAVSVISHAWFSMEAAVNLALFNLLKNTDCSYYLKPSDRKTLDKDISASLNKSYPLEKKLTYLNERMDCCNTLEELLGKFRPFERLRNALVHGYSIKKDMLLEELPETRKVEKDCSGSTTVITSYVVGHEEFTTPEGKFENVMKPYNSLGIINDFTKLCRHDAYRCLRISLFVLQWIDSHYGVQTSASWDVHNERFVFFTRKPKNYSRQDKRLKILVGKDSVMQAFSKKDGHEIDIAKKALLNT